MEKFALKGLDDAMKRKSNLRNKFGDTQAQVWASIQKDTAQADRSEGSLTIRLNVPVVRIDQVWLDHSHKVRCTVEKQMHGRCYSDLRPEYIDNRFQTRV